MLTAFQDPFFFTLTCTALGLIVGSFLNVVILRLPKMMEQSWRQECSELLDQPPPEEPHLTLSHPGSQCPGCGTPIKPWQNIPVISWLALRGQCAQCGMGISARYPFVELVTGLLSGLAAWQFGFGPEALSALVLIWVLIALTGIDMDTQLLPDSMTLPLLCRFINRLSRFQLVILVLFVYFLFLLLLQNYVSSFSTTTASSSATDIAPHPNQYHQQQEQLLIY